PPLPGGGPEWAAAGHLRALAPAKTLDLRLRGEDGTRNSDMSKVLIVAEHLDGKLNASTSRTACAALALSPAAIDVVVLAADPSAVAAESAQIAGVSKVLAVANDANAQPIAQVLAPQVAKLADGYSHVFLPSTTFGKDLAPCIAALLGVGQISDLMAVDGPHEFK